MYTIFGLSSCGCALRLSFEIIARLCGYQLSAHELLYTIQKAIQWIPNENVTRFIERPLHEDQQIQATISKKTLGNL